MTCFAKQNPIFLPAMRLIESITNANPAEVTTTFAHDYKDEAFVRLIVPRDNGMVQANKLKGLISVTSDTTFTIDINTLDFNAFVVPLSSEQCAQVVPVGEFASTLASAGS